MSLDYLLNINIQENPIGFTINKDYALLCYDELFTKKFFTKFISQIEINDIINLLDQYSKSKWLPIFLEKWLLVNKDKIIKQYNFMEHIYQGNKLNYNKVYTPIEDDIIYHDTMTVLREAVLRNYKELVYIILIADKKSKYNETAFISAIYDCNLEIVKTFLENGANPNMEYCGYGNTYMTPLMYAVKVDCNNDKMKQNYLEQIKLLLSYGASVNATSWDNYTAIEVAVSIYGDWRGDHLIDAIKIILATGKYYINRSIERYGSILGMACARSYDKKLIEILLEYKPDVNKMDSEGTTAIMYSLVNIGRKEIIELLLEHGANPNLENDRGYLLDYAKYTSRGNTPEILELIQKYGGKYKHNKNNNNSNNSNLSIRLLHM